LIATSWVNVTGPWTRIGLVDVPIRIAEPLTTPLFEIVL
jgi:hypothetical protein